MTPPIVSIPCHRALGLPQNNGRLPAAAWETAIRSRRFEDLVDGRPALLDTRVSALWTDMGLHILFEAEDPLVEATMTERDAPVFAENSVEIVLAGDDCYYELAVNAMGTVYEVLYIWKDAYARGERFRVPEFDVLGRNALTFGGDADRLPKTFWHGTHARGVRWAFLDWDLPGLSVHVDVDGSMNDSSQIDRGWTTEITLPWKGLRWLRNDGPIPPKPGEMLSVFFGRNQRLYIGGTEVLPAPIWALSPHGVRDVHQPERFPQLLLMNDTGNARPGITQRDPDRSAQDEPRR